MARLPRVDFEGAIHHAYGRGNDRRPIFKDDEDYRRFLLKLGALSAELSFDLIAYCLMPNHYHLIVRTGPVPLSRYMHRLLTGYAVSFNERWRSLGHPFQGRFKNRLCSDDNDLRGALRYVHLNPLKAGLVSSIDDWPWSSHRDVVGLSGLPGATRLMLGLFENDREAYRDFLRQPVIEKPSLEELALETGVIKNGGSSRQVMESRRQFAGRALECGHRRSEIARFLGVSRGTVCYLLKAETLNTKD